MAAGIEILAYDETPLGVLCLRRRRRLAEPHEWVTEVTLNHEFLMSSLHTDSERALATLALDELTGSRLRVLVGGLGLGYTAAAALANERVQHVEVVEFLPEVIAWTRQAMIPLGPELQANEKLLITQGDVYQRLLQPPESERFDAILIDVDHSPEDTLTAHTNAFYSVTGLECAKEHIAPGGILALWSYDEATPLLEAMRTVFAHTTVHPITYWNEHVQEAFTDWLYIAR